MCISVGLVWGTDDSEDAPGPETPAENNELNKQKNIKGAASDGAVRAPSIVLKKTSCSLTGSLRSQSLIHCTLDPLDL